MEQETQETTEIQPLQVQVNFVTGDKIVIQNAMNVSVGNGILAICNIYRHYINFNWDNVLYYGCVEDLV